MYIYIHTYIYIYIYIYIYTHIYYTHSLSLYIYTSATAGHKTQQDLETSKHGHMWGRVGSLLSYFPLEAANILAE